MIRLLLVDGLNLVRRVYAAQPGPEGPERAEGAKVSSSQSLERALREAEPTHAAAVFEGPEPTWRHEIFPDYKAGHSPMPEALREALPAYREAFAAHGVSSFELPGHEADDVLATLAVKVAAAGGSAVILSTDRIFLQLLSDRIAVRDHFGKRDLDRGHAAERFGVGPERLVDLWALTGDPGAGIPGVPGVGPKTAAKLLAAHGTLAAVLAAARRRAEGAAADGDALTDRLAGAIVEHAAAAETARTLVRLRTDLDLGLNLRQLRCAP